MAQKVGRKIVTDGLIYHLDPTNGQKGEEATITSPTQLSGCELWLDASDEQTIIGATAEEWKDKSGNLAHAGQGTSDNRPTLVKYGWNGLSYLSFDGSNDTMTGVLSNSIIDDSIFVVCRTKNSASDAGIFYVAPGSTSFGLKGLTHHNASNVYCYFSSGSIYKAYNMSTYSPNIISRSYADAVGTFHINGCEATTSNGTPADTALVYDYVIANATNECEIDIGEIIVYNRKLSQAELRQVEKYLSLKWKIGLGGRNIKNLAGGGLYASEVLEDNSTGGPIITHNNTLEFRRTAADNSDLRLEANEITIADNLPWTIEFWIKRNVRGNVRSIYAGVWGNELASSNFERLQFTAADEDKLILVDSSNNNSATAITNSVDIDCLHKWRHVVLTFDGTTDATTAGCINQYVDGSRKGANNIALTSADSKITIKRIGSRGSLTDAERLEGELGCFRVYNKELTHGEVLQNYNETKSRFQNTKMQLPSVGNLKLYVDADSGSSANDYSTGTWYDLSGGTANNGTRYSANFQARNPNNMKGMHYDFDGTNDYFDFQSTSDLDFIHSSNFTLLAWINLDGTGGGFDHIIGKSYADFRFAVENATLSFRMDSNNTNLTTGNVLSANVWHCIVGTYDGTAKTRTIYLDGAQIATNTVADLDWTNTTNKFQIGNSPGESYYFNGQIAVGMAWAATLSADEVLQAYNYFKHRYIKE